MSTREASAGKSITVSEIAITGVCIALTFVATGFINIRLPIAANGGLVHLGNVPLFLAAIIFGKRTGALAGSFGMALFDLMGGWVLWAPFTFVIVGLMGFTVGAITENHKGFRWNSLAIAAACVIKIVGYYIAEPYWGKGLGTSAIRQICEYIFRNTDIIRLFAEPFAHNIGSCRILEKSGFQLEGTLRKNAVKNGVVVDMKMYSILNCDKA